MAKVAMVASLRLAENGQYIEQGDTFMAEADRVDVLLKGGSATLLEDAPTKSVGIKVEAPNAVEDDDTDDDTDDDDTEQVEWPVKNMTPKVYLEKYPKGPKADLAKAFLAQAAKAALALAAKAAEDNDNEDDE